MSPRRLAGWEAAEVTTFEYDEAGRLSRTITVRESEWDDDQVAVLLASRRNEQRDSTGHLLIESTDLLANPANTAGTHYYVADLPHVNWAQRAEQQAREAFKRDNPGTDTAGYFWPIRRVERPSRRSRRSERDGLK